MMLRRQRENKAKEVEKPVEKPKVESKKRTTKKVGDA